MTVDKNYYHNIPTHCLSSPILEHCRHLSKTSVLPSGQTHSSGFSEDGTFSPGQRPKKYFECKINYQSNSSLSEP